MGRKRKHAPVEDDLPSNDDVDDVCASTNSCGSGDDAFSDEAQTMATTGADGSATGGRGTPGDKPPIQRNAANERERARMRVLSKAFTRLKTSLPWVPPDTKLSKLDTLRLASCYIAHLSQLLAEDGDEQTTTTTTTKATSTTSSGGSVGSCGSNGIISSSTNIHPINLVSI